MDWPEKKSAMVTPMTQLEPGAALFDLRALSICATSYCPDGMSFSAAWQ